METRTILHSDLNNFYASVECMLNPELRDKPLAVCGRVEERHGIVLAKNYIAKAYGVKTGESVPEAKCKCPKLTIVQPHYREYMKYSQMVRGVYMDYTDLVEPYGMDENWLDVTGSRRLFGDGETIANTIRERIKFEFGLTVSIGVSFNKIFAKLGSDMKKPDAVTCITRENFRDKIWGLPAGEMLGVGPAASKELRRFGVMTIGHLANCDEMLLSMKFGINGPRMRRYANGEDTSRVMPAEYHMPVKSVGNGTTFLSDLRNEDEVKPMLLALSDEVARRLRMSHKKARGISLMVRCNDLSWKEWQAKLDYPSQNAREIARRALAVFHQNYPWVKPLRAMSVRAIRLEDEDTPEQLSFFRDGEFLQKMETVDRTVDDIRNRFGLYAIQSAATMRLDKLPVINEEIELTMPSGMLTLT